MEWISVKDRLPADKQQCLCFRLSHYGNVYHLYWFYNSHENESGIIELNRFWGYDSEWGDFSVDNITHWMQLPEPPIGK